MRVRLLTNTYRTARLAAAALTCFSGLLLAAAGQLDPTFGTGGKVLTPFPTCPNFCGASANAGALQSDGKIVVGGTVNTQTGNGFQSVLVRYTANGRLDGTFGSGGVTKLPSSTPGGGFSAVAIQTDGKIVAATAQLEKGFIVTRFNTNGTLDSSFGSAGLTVFGNHIVFPPVAEGLLLQPDGKILVGYGALTRLNTDGSLDATFGSGGTAATVGGSGVALQSDGKMLVASGITLSRYNSDGKLDTMFGIAGIAGSPASFNSVAIEGTTGSIVAAGSFQTQPAPSGPQLIELAVLRYTSSGLPDVTFGSGGGGFAPPASSGLQSSAAAEVIQPNGSIVVGGQTAVVGAGGGSSNPQIRSGALYRYRAARFYLRRRRSCHHTFRGHDRICHGGAARARWQDCRGGKLV